MMRKTRVLLVVCILLLVFPAAMMTAQGQKEPVQEKEQAPAVVAEPVQEAIPEAPVQEEVTKAPVTPAVPGTDIQVNLAVFKGPTGFGFARLIEDGPDLVDGISVSSEILPTPTEAVARLTSGDVDIVAMPVNLASSLYQKGVDVKLAAVTGEGMMYVLSTDASGNINSFKNKEIHIPGAGSTPEFVTRYVFENSGYTVGEDIEFNFSLTSAAQLAQMLIAGKVSAAVLPEPFATMAVMKNPELKRTVDLQSLWSRISGEANYPMTAMLVRGAFLKEHPQAVNILKLAAEDSILWVNSNPKEASVLIEKHGILTAALAEPAIPNCNLIYREAQDAKASIEAYLSVLKDYAPASIGGDLPDEAFYLAK